MISWELFDDYPYQSVGPSALLEGGVLTNAAAAAALERLLAIDFPSKVHYYYYDSATTTITSYY